MKVWELSASEIGFSSFCFPEKNKVEQWIQYMDKAIEGSQDFSKKWEPLVLLKDQQRIDPDFLDFFDSDGIIVSEDAAATILMIAPQDDFMLLPFLNDEKQYFLFYLKKTTDCLNKETSEYNTFDNGLISDYQSISFKSDIIRDIPIFKIPELPYKIFVTNIFQYFYGITDLKGLNFDDDNIIFMD